MILDNMKKNMKKVAGGITAVSGFEAAGLGCGLKKNGSKDLALIYSRKPAAAAGVFTRNKYKAPPLILTQKNISNPVQAVIINSGNANACTGERGLRDAKEMAKMTAEKLGLQKEEVLVASTGVIGNYLPMEKISSGIGQIVQKLSPAGGEAAAQAILTTDTVIKMSAYRVQVDGGKTSFTLGGMAKGSGMICPDMATMLAFISTDAAIKKESLQKALRQAVDYTFNLITVDGDTSTNDMVLLLANGFSGVQIREGSPLWEVFCEALFHICRDLAYQIVSDGEGATKVVKLTIKGVPDYHTGRVLARKILNSSLVRTAFFGEDANWGRIVMAMGYARVHFIPEKVDIFLGTVQVAAAGEGLLFDEAEAKAVLMKREIPVVIDLHLGEEKVTAYGCDLSHEYVSINSSYRS